MCEKQMPIHKHIIAPYELRLVSMLSDLVLSSIIIMMRLFMVNVDQKKILFVRLTLSFVFGSIQTVNLLCVYFHNAHINGWHNFSVGWMLNTRIEVSINADNCIICGKYLIDSFFGYAFDNQGYNCSSNIHQHECLLLCHQFRLSENFYHNIYDCLCKQCLSDSRSYVPY